MARTICVGIAGPSSSGKTTLARLLVAMHRNALLIHEDDFYKADAEMPLHPETNVADWDSPLSFNHHLHAAALLHAQKHMSLPAYVSCEGDALFDAADLLSPDEFDHFGARLRQLVPECLIITDGIFVLHDPSVKALLDVEVFVSAGYETLKTRREARSGYRTADGDFWVDPPGYFDDVVWPSYLRHNQHLIRRQQDGAIDGVVLRLSSDEQSVSEMVRSLLEHMECCLRSRQYA